MTVTDYIAALPDDRRDAFQTLHSAIDQALPPGFEQQMLYNMPHWAVPLSTFPDGYHCAPGQALPFMGLGNAKRHIAVYHMGVYADEDLLSWFQAEYAQRVKTKLNMGKSCIRFTNPKKIPVELIAELCSKMTVDRWLELYTASRPA